MLALSGMDFFTIMADEFTDIANKEQFVVCTRWVDETLTDHEDVIGVYNVDTIDARTLTSAIHDVLLRMSLKMSQCRGQCYDGASNMTGSKNGVATRFLAYVPRALLTHCYGDALNLAVADAIKQSKGCRDALDIAFEVSKLIRFSPKRNAALNRIKVENPAEEEPGPSHNICSFCPKRWTVRGDAIESIIDNFDSLKKLWEECLETKLDPDFKGRIIGVQTQMLHYNALFGLLLSKKILKISDNLSRTLQKQAMSAAEGQTITELTVRTLKGMRTEESFTLFFDHVGRFRELNDTEWSLVKGELLKGMKLDQGKGPTTQMWKIITVTSIMKHWTLLSLASLTALINPVMSCTRTLKVCLLVLQMVKCAISTSRM